MKKFLLLLLFPLALFSCGKMKIYGHYAFQMGGDKSTHFGVFLDLTKEQVLDEETKEVLGEKFNFGMKLSKDAEPKEPDPEDPNFLEKFFAYEFVRIMNVEADPDAGISGFFNIGDKYIEDFGKRLFLTIQLGDLQIPIPEQLFEIIIVAYVDGKQIQMILPVSLADFQYQLCWYGIFVDFYECTYYLIDDPERELRHGIDVEIDPILWTHDIPGPEKMEDRIGTHPTKEEIEQMKTECQDVFDMKKEDYNHLLLPTDECVHVEEPESLGYEFNDYYTLAVDLLKS